MTTRLPFSPRTLWILAVVFTVLWFATLDFRKLIKPDEGRYAEIPREMVVSGDWITPRLNDLKYFEKPPLQYWVTAAIIAWTDAGEWQARWWPAFTGFIGVVLLGFTVGRIYGLSTGIWAAIVLGSCVWWSAIAHMNTLDMGVACFMTVTFCSWCLAEHQWHTTGARARAWMLSAWLGMALAMLSKGLIAVVLPGAALAVYLLIWRDWSLLRRLEWLRGLGLFFLIAAPWFILVAQRNPEFAHFFFIHEHFERFLTKAHRREGPIWYFVPMLLIGLLPWTGFLPRAIKSIVIKSSLDQNASQQFAARFALVWAVFIFVFFSLSSSKLPSYILPIFPALALLVARVIERCSASHVLRQCVGLLALIVITTIIFVVLDYPINHQADPTILMQYQTYDRWLWCALAVLSVGVMTAALLAHQGRSAVALVIIASAAFLASNITLLGHESLRRIASTYDLVQQIRPLVDADSRFYSVKMFDHTLPYYLRRPVTLVQYRDELDLGLTQEPHKGIATVGEFMARWRADQSAFAIMRPDTYQQLSEQSLPMSIIFRDARYVVISRAINQ